MSIEEQLRQIILSKYKSVRAFTMDVGIPYSTIDSVFRRGIANSGVSTMIKVFNALDLDIESVTGEILLAKTPKNPPDADKPASGEKELRAALLENFEQLNQEGQERLVETSDDMVSSGKYIKSDTNKLGAENYA